MSPENSVAMMTTYTDQQGRVSSAHILEEGQVEKRIRGEEPSDEFYAEESDEIIGRLGGDDDWFRRSVEKSALTFAMLSVVAISASAGITWFLF